MGPISAPKWDPKASSAAAGWGRCAIWKPESHRTGSAFEIAKANTPYSQRKQINLTLHGTLESVPATKKRRTPHPLRKHVHRCLNRYFRNPTFKEHPQRKRLSRREDKNNLPSTRPSGLICGTKTSKDSLEPTCSKRKPELPRRQERLSMFEPSCPGTKPQTTSQNTLSNAQAVPNMIPE